MVSATPPAHRGLRAFAVVWSGQFCSLTGSGLSNFALGVYAYQLTGSVATLGFVYALAYLPFFLASPLTGSLVDRWGPKRAMVVSNGAAMAIMVTFAMLLTVGAFALWQLYVVVSLMSVVGALQTPAFEAAIPLLVPKNQLGRANGMRTLALATSQVTAPVAAGFLLLAIHLSGVLLMDCASYVLALLTLLAVRIPRQSTDAEHATRRSPLADFASAWRRIVVRRGLLALLALTGIVNFCGGFVELLITPLVLSFGSTDSLGTVMTVGGVGMLVASLAMSAWGGPRNRVNGILGFCLLMGCATILGGVRPSAVMIAIAAFVFLGSSAIVIGCNQTVWQAKTDPRMLGRTMALLGMLVSAPQLLAYALAGITADWVFAPLVGRERVHGRFLQLLLGDGPGRGYALLIMVTGLVIIGCALAGVLYPRLRRLDTEVPDARPESDEEAAEPSTGVPDEPATATTSGVDT